MFVLASLLAGGAFREWRRSHESRFEDLVADLEFQDTAARSAAPAPGPFDAPIDSVTGGGPLFRGREAGRRAGDRGPALVPSRIDLDRATARELERLPGIGPGLAARILADRAERGPYRTPDALLRVKGIGPRTLERIRPYLSAPAGAADSGSPIAN
ncbi:MAG TPA: helix-hairpin-helix domain-containing protein [Candidatus Eisenbacteria bacterium]|nr:helix-hairpin-helix domain-containing protein [Candidatus Eisenbacteria bacterium]